MTSNNFEKTIKDSRNIKKNIDDQSIFMDRQIKKELVNESETEKETEDIDETEETEDIEEISNKEIDSEISEDLLDEESDIEDIDEKEETLILTETKKEDQCNYNKIDENIIIDDEIEIDEKEEEIILAPEDRITKNKLTIFEQVRILGLRAKQISLGAKIMIRNSGNISPLEIAELELKHNVIPFKIKRYLPNNYVEIWKLSELEK
jgi:DNA-directed RNA polymerase subunit K/omega